MYGGSTGDYEALRRRSAHGPYFAVTQPLRACHRLTLLAPHGRRPGRSGPIPSPPPKHFHTSHRSLGSLTARADRPVPAGFASGIRVAAGYLWRRLSPRSFAGRCNGPRSPAPEPRRPVPSRCLKGALECSGRALPAQRPRRVLLAWLAWILCGPVARSPRGSTYFRQHDAGVPGAREVRAILKEP